jgi:hypothetical protein
MFLLVKRWIFPVSGFRHCETMRQGLLPLVLTKVLSDTDCRLVSREVPFFQRKMSLRRCMTGNAVMPPANRMNTHPRSSGSIELPQRPKKPFIPCFLRFFKKREHFRGILPCPGWRLVPHLSGKTAFL